MSVRMLSVRVSCNFYSPTFVDIVKRKSVGDYSGIPYICTLLNCLLWVVYGLPVVELQVLVVTINAAGVVIEMIYIGLYLKNAQRSVRVNSTIKNVFLHRHQFLC